MSRRIPLRPRPRPRWTRALLAGLALLSVAAVPLLAPQSTPAQGEGGLDTPLVFVQEPVAPGPGSRIVRREPDGEVRVLTGDFADAADPAVSFDGARILFAGRRRGTDGWEIWRMDADGDHVEPVTEGMADARHPAWLAPAAVNAPTFDDRVPWITFTSTSARVWDERGAGPLASLYALSLADVGTRGRVLWRTTYGLGGDRTPTVLADGRVLFASWQRGATALMTISWAGENLNVFAGSHDSLSQWSPAELPAASRAGASTVVFVEGDGTAPDAGGRLAAVSMRRPLHSHRVISADGAWRTPAAIPGGGLLAARRAPGAATFGLVRVDPETGAATPLHDDPAWHDVAPAVVAPRVAPRGRIPTVDFASVLDVEGFERAGQLQCLNVAETDRPEIAAIPPGAVRRVRLVAGVPRPWVGSEATVGAPEEADVWPPSFIETRSLGEAPVEADGSFYVNVAGDVPFYLETLDEAGRVLGTMRAWTWVRAGDQRGCVGCHENKEMAPPNRATEALRRARPESLTGTTTAAAGAAGEAAP